MIGRYRITDQLLDEFRRRLVTEEKSELTIAQYMRDVRDFCGFLQKGEPVDKEEAIAYKDHLVKTYRSSATVNTKLAALNKFFAATGMDGCRVKLLRRQRRMFCETDRELTREEYLAAARDGAKKQQAAPLPDHADHLLHRHPGERAAVDHRAGGGGEPRRGVREGQAAQDFPPAEAARGAQGVYEAVGDRIGAGVRDPGGPAARPEQHLARHEKPLPVGGSGVHEGLPAQPAPPVREGILRDG